MRLKHVVPILLLGALAGCESLNSISKPRESQRAEATQEWNGARAGVLGSLATEQFKSGNLDKARETVDSAIKLNPKNAALHALSGKIALEQAQLELAEKEFQRAQLIDPRQAESFYLDGVVYQRWQKPEQAYEAYQQAEAAAPQEVAYTLASAEMLVAMNRSEDALNYLQAKADSFEHSAALGDEMGEIQAGQGKYDDAVKTLRQASILATDDDAIREHLALALYFDKQYRESADMIGRLVENDKFKQRADLYLALGESYEQINRSSDAKAAFETATQINPGSSEAWTGLAKASLENNDVRRAEMSLRKAISLDPNGSEPQLLLGYIRLRENHMDEALTCFKKAAALNESDTVGLCMVGYVYEKSGQNDLAIQCYAKALKLHPGDEMATKLMAAVDVNE